MENSPIKQNNALIKGAGMTTGNQQGGFVSVMDYLNKVRI